MLSVKVSSFYEKKILEEFKILGHVGPLHKCVYSSDDKVIDALYAPEESPDFVRDSYNMPPGLNNVIVRKYPDRVLFLLTDICFAHCRYCCR